MTDTDTNAPGDDGGSNNNALYEDAAKRPFNPEGGEDEASVVVAPHGAAAALLLARAVDDRQRSAIGDQGGGRVFLFLETDDFVRDHLTYTQRGIRFVEELRSEPYGTVAVFEDLYGNRWDLIEPVAVRV